jgi:hypothetical protein
VAAAASALLSGQAASASAIWVFDAPATGSPSQNPPYPIVATLTLTQTADGVQFVLDPNEGNPGFGGNSFVQRLDLAYTGPALTASSFRSDAGAPASLGFASKRNMDAGYAADGYAMSVDFPSRNDGSRFGASDTSTWTVLGATLSQFTDSFADANDKPGPIHAAISLTSFSLRHPTPTPSNWVCLVPEPGSAGLMLLGVSWLGFARRGRC